MCCCRMNLEHCYGGYVYASFPLPFIQSLLNCASSLVPQITVRICSDNRLHYSLASLVYALYSSGVPSPCRRMAA